MWAAKQALYASVAQSVEQGTENPCVGGSIPPRGTNRAGVAQLAEQLICNQQVVGSIPITSSIERKPSAVELHIREDSRAAKWIRL